MIRGRAGAVAGLLLTAGCASSLHTTKSVDALIVRGAPADPTKSTGLLAQAEARFAERSPLAARRAIDLWLEAARDPALRIPAALGAARAGVWLAGHEDRAADREHSAAGAVRAAQLCLRTDPDDIRCGYWLALALGVQARERRTTALDALPRIVRLLEDAAARQPALEHAGPHRALALLYLRAPGWPAGPGDPDLGLVHARRAVELAPGYPPNQMSLAEGLLATEDSQGSAQAYALAAALARDWLARGETEAAEWLERSERRAGLR